MIAVTGSFDPFTSGHLWLVEQGIKYFGQVHVIMAENPKKIYMFSLDERMDIARLSVPDDASVHVMPPGETWAADFAKSLGCKGILRGVRDIEDFSYEKMVADFNRNELGVETVFVPGRSEVSSTQVKAAILQNQSIDGLFATKKAQEYVELLIKGKNLA